MNNNKDCPIRLALYCLPIEADAKLRPALERLQAMEDAISYGEKTCALLVAERDALRVQAKELAEALEKIWAHSCRLELAAKMRDIARMTLSSMEQK